MIRVRLQILLIFGLSVPIYSIWNKNVPGFSINHAFPPLFLWSIIETRMAKNFVKKWAS